MRFIRNADFDEFVRWYLSRERRKLGLDGDLQAVSDEALRREMCQFHPGKVRAWFERARWSVVSLESIDDAMSLVCVECSETKRNGLMTGGSPDYRLARNVIAAARRNGHFESLARESAFSNQAYFERERMESFRRDLPLLCGEERVVICSLNLDEKAENPSAGCYLHDGFGRMFPWLYLINFEGRMYSPIEAFYAEEIYA